MHCITLYYATLCMSVAQNNCCPYPLFSCPRPPVLLSSCLCPSIASCLVPSFSFLVFLVILVVRVSSISESTADRKQLVHLQCALAPLRPLAGSHYDIATNTKTREAGKDKTRDKSQKGPPAKRGSAIGIGVPQAPSRRGCSASGPGANYSAQTGALVCPGVSVAQISGAFLTPTPTLVLLFRRD